MSAAADAPRAVLFDLDGTLLDTAQDLSDALNALRGEQGLDPLDFVRVRTFVSHGSSALVRIAFPQAPEPKFLSLRDRLLELYGAALAVHTRPFAGVPQLLAYLERAGLPWGVVTNKPAHLTEPLLEALALRRRAAAVVSGDTLPERKPHPRPLLFAAEQLGVAPAACVYVGDAERDVLAARAAGMRAVVACFGYIGPSDTPRQWPADAWLEAPEELIAYLESSRERTAAAERGASR
ncbi:MAG TPA: phosphoglycolate phosphatase [Steroidobacteraceae bacterium]|nr:phosphoglycolate phosphatase [Steroidobacteraceae bacterium]